MSLKLNHRSEIVIDGVATGYIAVPNVATGIIGRVVKCSTNRDLALPLPGYKVTDPQFERDFRKGAGWGGDC